MTLPCTQVTLSILYIFKIKSKLLANADLEVANSTKFWVGASNLKCNIAWENGGEIEFNDMWAPESRYYGVAIDKMSIGGLWHTVPVGQKLPFVCTFQGKSNEGKENIRLK